MELSNWMTLLGGLALFLHGMDVLSEALESAAGSRLKGILEKLTNTKIKAVIVGFGVTAAVQSSSAVTFMLIGFMNAGLMTLNRATWVIMGSNIGTTTTGLMMSFNVGVFAPAIALVGAFIPMFAQKKKTKAIGNMMLGFGVLFIGLEMMSDAMVPLQESEFFLNLIQSMSNPILAICVAAIFTAIIKSSGAAIGILESLATQGLMPFSTAAYMVCGLNIGTCLGTAFLTFLQPSRNGKRISLFHIFFNTFGTIFFLIVAHLLPVFSWVQALSANPARQIGLFHMIFNIVTTVIVLPFDNYMMNLIYKLMPIKGEMLVQDVVLKNPNES